MIFESAIRAFGLIELQMQKMDQTAEVDRNEPLQVKVYFDLLAPIQPYGSLA
jgi:hypothetical protein